MWNYGTSINISSKAPSGPFFSKSGNFFLPSCAPVSVAEYASISLNMPKYPWNWLNKLFWLCQGSEYVCSSYMFDRLLKMPPVLNKQGFWIWDDCICKGYAEFRVCLIMTPYASLTPEYALMSLNMHKNRWIFLNVPECMNIPEYAWINCSHYARVLNMPRYSYDNIIIFVTKDIWLEFFSATISYFFNTS